MRMKTKDTAKVLSNDKLKEEDQNKNVDLDAEKFLKIDWKSCITDTRR